VSASDLAEDLRRVREHRPIRARRPAAAVRLVRWAQRNPAAAALMLVLAVGIAANAWLTGETARAYSESEAARDWLDKLAAGGLIEQAEQQLWPIHPNKVPALESWLTEARRLLGRRRRHERVLAEVRARGQSTSENVASRDADAHPVARPSNPRWTFTDPGDQLLHDERVSLLRMLDGIAEPNTGSLAAVARRLEQARELPRRTLEDAAPKWRAAIASIADPEACPAYQGLTVKPQLGLIPVGRDPDSGFWEFAHLLTGKPPERNPEGKLVMTEESAVVLVLIPGGSFRMGAIRPSAVHPVGSPNVDPCAHGNEGPVHTVTLDAFFISKFEMNQAQWLRIAGENPSAFFGTQFSPDESYFEKYSRKHPVERVSHATARTMLVRVGLTLPTEAQWEYAARGGTDTPWFTRGPASSLEGFANVADVTHSKILEQGRADLASFNDGWAGTAPIGSYRPNAFGLHDTCGNVAELCLDWYGSYRYPVLPASGKRCVPWSRKRSCVARGGSLFDSPVEARSAGRVWLDATQSLQDCGIRPARRLDP